MERAAALWTSRPAWSLCRQGRQPDSETQIQIERLRRCPLALQCLVNEREGFAGNGMLQPVDQKTRNVSLDHDGHSASRPQVFGHTGCDRRVGLNGTHHLDTGHQMGRHEEMGPQHTTGPA